MAKAQSEHLWLTQYMVSEQNLGSNEKGTKVGAPAEAIEKRKPRTNRFLHDQNLRGMQESLKDKMKEVMQFNSSLNNSTDNNKYQFYRCFKCKELGHINKFCQNEKKTYKKKRMEGIEAPKPTVTITYPETVHFSTTSMVKDTDLTTWDEIWYVSDKLDRHVCYKLDSFCYIKENFNVTNLENQNKFLVSYGMGEVLVEQGRESIIIPGAPEVTLNIFSQELLEKQ
ncbi:ARID DNA-binding domain-containing protein, partial [Tanacetum coccineum]